MVDINVGFIIIPRAIVFLVDLQFRWRSRAPFLPHVGANAKFYCLFGHDIIYYSVRAHNVAVRTTWAANSSTYSQTDPALNSTALLTIFLLGFNWHGFGINNWPNKVIFEYYWRMWIRSDLLTLDASHKDQSSSGSLF